MPRKPIWRWPGTTRSALDLLRQARRATPWTAPVDALLGRAHDLMDRPDSAIAAYTRYLETPWYDRREPLFGDPVLRGPTLERLALLHDDAGRSAQAVRYAAELVELWEGADAVLQPRVDRARRILQRAAAEGR